MVMYVPFHFAHMAASDRDGDQRRMSLSPSSPSLAPVLQDILLSKHSLPAGLGGGGERSGNNFITHQER